jgi:predicted dehydrogenase
MQGEQIDRREFLKSAGMTALFGGSATASAPPAAEPPIEVGRGRLPLRTAEHMEASTEVRLITLDPAHFHAALVQKEMLPGIAKRVSIYAPLGPDLLAHLSRIEQFNTRAEDPTNWELDVHCSPRSLDEMLSARPGNVVVLSGRNRGKIDKIKASLDAGLNVLADKPWIIRAEDLHALESALDVADHKGLVGYDMMTERYEITTIIQRELVNDPAILGSIVPTSDNNPGVFMESVHHIMKTVAGLPSLRPLSFFDIQEEGEGLTDVGTHLVDLVQWTLFPNQAINYREDIKVVGAKRWATPITASQFRRITGGAGFPAVLAPYVQGDRFDYCCNNQVDYKIRGIHVRLNVLWDYESPADVDFHHAVYRGTNARIEVRQTDKENYRPELYVAPNGPERYAAVLQALRDRIERLQGAYPGIECEVLADELRVSIPDRYRVGHEAHFAQVLAQFLKYLKSPESMPAWERPNMIAKYYVTTAGVQLRCPT